MSTVFSLVLIALAAGSGRFEAADGAVRDTKTSLEWSQKDNGADVDFKGAKAFCDGLTVAGHDDWRLPTLQELQGLYDEAVTSPPTYLYRGKPYPLRMDLRVPAHRAGDLELVDALREPRRGVELLLQLRTTARHRADGDQLSARALRPGRPLTPPRARLRDHVVDHHFVLDDRPDDVGEEPLMLGVHLIGLERRLVVEVHDQGERVTAVGAQVASDLEVPYAWNRAEHPRASARNRSSRSRPSPARSLIRTT